MIYVLRKIAKECQHCTDLELLAEDREYSSIAPCVLYLRTDNANITDQNLHDFEISSKVEFDTCDSMGDFLMRLADQTKVNPSLILIDHSMLSSNNTMMPDLVNMITTMVSFMGRSAHKAHIAVVIDKTCSKEFLKSLQKTTIDGIVPKTDSLGYDIMSISLCALLNDEYHWPRAIIELLAGKELVNSRRGIELTPRQTEVMGLICTRGLCNKKIASTLKISESTVKVHISLILKAYGVRNRTQLVLAANAAPKTKVM